MASANRIGAMSGDDANELQSEPSQTQNAAMLLARRVVPNKAEILGEEYEESDADPNMATLHVQFRGVTHDVHVPDANSLVCLKTNNPLRKWVAFIVHSRHFDNIVLIFIFITSVTLLLERPDDTIIADACPKPPAFLDCSGLGPGQTEQIACARDEKEPDFDRVWSACDSDGPKPPCCNIVKRVETFRNMDVVFTLFFLVEMILKIVSDGLVAHKHAYLRNPWNVLDAAIVAVSLFSSFGSGESLKSLKALRALRALRPLRVIKRNPGLKIAVVCLLSSIPAMFNVIIVVIVWFSMYAMLGVQLFKGSLYRYDRTRRMHALPPTAKERAHCALATTDTSVWTQMCGPRLTTLLRCSNFPDRDLVHPNTAPERARRSAYHHRVRDGGRWGGCGVGGPGVHVQQLPTSAADAV